MGPAPHARHEAFNMTTEREFLEIIRADLDNPVPRLIFADWLDEQGDPRGEFIRAQCELEQPGLSALKNRWLRQRERELLEDYKTDWLRPIEGRKLKTAAWEFRRGFVEGLSISAREFIECGDFFHQAFPLLCSLNLRNVNASSVEPLADCPALQGIAELRFSADFGRGRGMVYDQATAIQRFLRSPYLANLRTLDLSDASFGNEELRGVLACGNLTLRTLDLSRNNILPTGIRLGLDTFQSLATARCVEDLRRLVLRSNRLSINHVLILTYSDHLQNLDTLDLAGNRLGSQSNMIALVGLEKFPALAHLGLKACGVGDAGIEALIKTRLWPQLASLNLWNNEITDRGLMRLTDAEPSAKRRRVELQRNVIGDAGLTALAKSPALSSFQAIHLEHNRIGEAGVLELAGTRFGENLEAIHLRGNAEISDRSGAALAEGDFPRLEVLDLAGTGVGDQTAIALAESPAASGLRIVDLAGTQVGERGAQAIAASDFLDSLEFLDLRMNHLSGNCVQALVERFGRRVFA